MSRIDRILVHKHEKALVTVDVYARLLASYYGAEYAKLAHVVRACLCVDWLFIFCYYHIRIFKYTKVPTFYIHGRNR